MEEIPDNLSPRQFHEHKLRANRIAKSIKVKGTWINPDPGVIADKQKATRNWHDTLRPVKATLKEAGVAWPTFRNHINNHPDAPGNERKNLQAAIALHASDPSNFLKNIGLK